MKYLKLFEDYNDKPNKYYFEISSDEFLPKFIDNNIGTLTESELKSINDLGYSFQIKYSSFAGDFYHHNDANTTLQFFMAPEEWFYVMLQNQTPGQKYIAKYYKCDQFDGLLKFLRNYIAYSIFSNKKDRLLRESTNYYSEISSDEFDLLVYGPDMQPWINLTKDELKSINDIGFNFQIKNSAFRGDNQKCYYLDRSVPGKRRSISDKFSHSLMIIKLSDEWFYLSISEYVRTKSEEDHYIYIDRYYKCDQIDGLLQKLKEYKNLRSEMWFSENYLTESDKLYQRLLTLPDQHVDINENLYYIKDNPHEPSKIPPGSKEGEVIPNDISDTDINFIKKGLGIDTKTNIIKREFLNPNTIVSHYIFYYNMKGEVGNLNTMSNTHHRDIRLVHVYSYTDEWFKVRIDDRLYWCDQVDAVVKCVQDSIDKDVFYNNINESIHHPNLPEITDEYFYQITPDEFHSLLGISQGYLNPLQILKFSVKEISYLDKLDKEDLTRTGVFNYAFDVMFHRKSITFKMIDGKFADISGEIFKVNDEWFLVELILDVIDIPIHYKCDQIEGLIDFLKKLKKKK